MEPYHRYLHRIGIVALIPALVTGVGLLNGGGLLFPDTNRPDDAYLDYVFPHRTGEVWVFVWNIAPLSIAAVLVALAALYSRRAGRPTFSGLFAVCCAAAWLAMECISSTTLGLISLMGRGYPSFGADETDSMATLLWNLTTFVYAFGLFPLAGAMISLAVANRSDPILPKAVGQWGAAVAAVNAVGVTGVSMFISHGRWSTGNPWSFYLGFGPVFVWLVVVGGVLLSSSGQRPLPSLSSTRSEK
ncbi:hypothetical protein ACWGJ2_21085 [Streptomyces sp. NPDC054796]